MPRIAVHTTTHEAEPVFHDNMECSFIKTFPSTAAIFRENVRFGRGEGRRRCMECEARNIDDHIEND